MTTYYPTPVAEFAFDTPAAQYVAPSSGWSVPETAELREAQIKSPHRNGLLDVYEPGSVTLSFDDEDRELDPSNSLSPHYGKLLPNRRVRVSVGYESLIKSHHPTAYWRLGENPATGTATDEMNSYNGTYTGTGNVSITGFLSGSTDRAVDFSDNTASTGKSYVTVSPADSGLSSSAFSIECWVKADALDASILAKVNEFSLGTFFTVPIFGIVNSIGGNYVALTGVSSMATGTTYHLAATWDGTTARLYVNGSQVNSTTTTSGSRSSSTSGALYLGRGATTANGLNGKLDEVAYYSRALTADEIAKHYQEGTQGTVEKVLFTGYVDQWKQSYEANATTRVDLTATTSAKLFSNIVLPSLWERTILADSPTAWWRLGETAGSVLADSSGNNFHGTYSEGFTRNTGAGLVANEENPSIEWKGQKKSVLIEGRNKLPHVFYFANGNAKYTIELCFSTSTAPSGNDVYLYRQGIGSVKYGYVLVSLEDGGNTISIVDSETASGAITTTLTNLCDGDAHHLVITKDNTDDFNLYVDGENVTSTGSFANYVPNYVPYGSRIGDSRYEGFLDEVTVYKDKVLTAGQVLEHYQAFSGTLWDGDTTGQRVGRILDVIGWPDELRDVDTGNTVLGPVNTTDKTVRAYLDDIAKTEMGAWYLDENGTVRFRQRDKLVTDSRLRYRQLTFSDTETAAGSGASLGGAVTDYLYSDTDVANGLVIPASGWLSGPTAPFIAEMRAFLSIPVSGTLDVDLFNVENVVRARLVESGSNVQLQATVYPATGGTVTGSVTVTGLATTFKTGQKVGVRAVVRDDLCSLHVMEGIEGYLSPTNMGQYIHDADGITALSTAVPLATGQPIRIGSVANSGSDVYLHDYLLCTYDYNNSNTHSTAGTRTCYFFDYFDSAEPFATTGQGHKRIDSPGGSLNGSYYMNAVTWTPTGATGTAYPYIRSSSSVNSWLDLRVRVVADDYTPSSNEYYLSKWNTTGDQRGYRFSNNNGTLTIQWSRDGSTPTFTTSSTAPITGVDGQPLWLRVVWDGLNGNRYFYQSTTDTQNPLAVTWTQVGATVTGGSISSINGRSTANLDVGIDMAGEVLAVYVQPEPSFVSRCYTDLMADPPSTEVTSWYDYYGNNWQTTGNVTLGFQADSSYAGLVAGRTDEELYNVVTVTRAEAGGEPQTARDDSLVTEYFERSLNLSGMLYQQESDAESTARYLLLTRSKPRNRFNSMKLDMASSDQRAVIFDLDLETRIRVVRSPNGDVTNPVTVDCYVHGISHRIGPESWITEVLLEPVADDLIDKHLVLDDDNLGYLDTNTVFL